MGLVNVKVEMGLALWGKKVRAARGRILEVMAATIQTNRAFLFETEGAYNGHKKWAPLKFRNGQILSDSGTLRNSIGPMARNGKPVKKPGGIVKMGGGITNPQVIIGTSLAYAPIQNGGGVITPKNGKKVLWIPLPAGKNATKFVKDVRSKSKKKGYSGPPIVRYKGKTFLLAKKVTIPARPFGQEAWNQQDQDEVNAAVANIIVQVLNK